MDRRTAGELLGVPSDASVRAVDRAFRRRARGTHPDSFPPGSEAWEDASYRLRELVEARQVLRAPAPPPRVAGTAGADDSGWAWRDDVSPARADATLFLSPRDVDRRVRAWGVAWGGFLVISAIVSLLVGASQPTNDALPFWSPALALTGATALAIGLRAHQRLTRG